MFSVIGELIPYGAAVALSPLPIMAVLLLLMAPIGVRGAGAFLLARLLCLVAVAGGVGFLSHAVDEAAGSKGPTASIRIVLGLLLAGLALLKWNRRPAPGEEPKIPKWMASIEASGLSSAFRVGLVLTIFNVKELAFAAGAGLAVGAAMLAPLQAGLSVLVFAVLACFTLLLPVALVLVVPEESAAALASARTWLMQNNAVIMAVILLLIGALLVGGGLSELD
ncbi:GAP family protein [Glutamicibacter protophormiae]|uniref:GAP family protein n=1 Tax=Glutamicibacter protophormiae TaxID=37930 RepID=UPI002A81ACD5|nr:GAP family protein [Glutamicibacter protophormiae]WPR64183.1 GAP family protein [Glutamicibacter protophormiae]WPR67677.1 GAP family protein [Glutamicibacter protophormiae]